MLTVFQTFETLGDPAESTYPTRAAAETAAGALREQIAGMVAGWQVPDDDPRWARAREAAIFAGGCYGAAAGELIAREAVRVDGREVRWRVYYSPDGGAEEFCGEFSSRAAAEAHAETEPAGAPESDWESHRKAGGHAALLAPDPAGTLAPEAESWHGSRGWHCVIPVHY